MTNEQKFTEETVLWVKHHSPKHLTFAITRPESYRFTAGQFARLGFVEGAGYIWRAYSITSAEYDDVLEFCRENGLDFNTEHCMIIAPLSIVEEFLKR